MAGLGKLHRLNAREAWAHKATHFTPWLLESVSTLGEVPGMDLELNFAEFAVA